MATASGFGGLRLAERLVPDRLRRAAWLRPRFPTVGVEVREDAVFAVRLRRQRDGWHLAGHGRRDLPDSVFMTSRISPVVADPARLAQAVSEALEDAGADGAAKISIVLPDTAARVSLVDFQEIPSSSDQVADLVRWRLKKSVPFPLDDAQVSWQELGRAEDGRVQMLVAVAAGDGVRGVEAVLEALGLRVGLIDLASFDLLNALRLAGAWGAPAEDDSGGDNALLSASPGYFSLMITRGERLIFYRAKAYHPRGGFHGESSLRVVSRELRSTLSYYEEHLLGEGIGTLLTRTSGVDSAGIERVARELGSDDVRSAAVARVVPELDALPEESVMDLLPAIGVALRREP